MEEIHKPEWSIDKTYPEMLEGLILALSGVMDPDLGYSILDLGLVREVSYDGTKANVRMILTTPFCPYGPAMMEETRMAAEKVMAVPTTIEYGSEVWNPEMMSPELRDDEWGLMGF